MQPDRESVWCPQCAADAGQPCDFPPGKPWTITENGVKRRVVHVVRYAATMAALPFGIEVQ